jgi:hypothetical protein
VRAVGPPHEPQDLLRASLENLHIIDIYFMDIESLCDEYTLSEHQATALSFINKLASLHATRKLDLSIKMEYKPGDYSDDFDEEGEYTRVELPTVVCTFLPLMTDALHTMGKRMRVWETRRYVGPQTAI